MTNVNIATSAEQPINRYGAVSQYAGSEGELVGQDSNGDWVKADADAATAVQAVGILYAPVTDPADYPTEVVRQQVESNRELVGENRISAGSYGVVVENSDEDWGFTPGEPVYLAPGGGYTQTKPTGVGDIVQVVGRAAYDGEAVFLSIEDSHEIVDSNGGDAVFSGDGSTVTFSIQHGLSQAPSTFEVTPTSAGAAGDSYVSATADTLDVTFSTAPASGTDNVTFNWNAQE